MTKNIQIIFKYCENNSSGKQSNPENFLNSRFVIFRCQKYVKKGYIEMTKKFTLRLLKSVLGRSVFHYSVGNN